MPQRCGVGSYLVRCSLYPGQTRQQHIHFEDNDAFQHHVLTVKLDENLSQGSHGTGTKTGTR